MPPRKLPLVLKGPHEPEAKRQRQGEPTSGVVLLRKLLPRWANALASGEKLVEFVSYTKGHGNAMKRFTTGTVMVVSSSGTSSVVAVAVASNQAVVQQGGEDMAGALQLVPSSMRAGVQEHLCDKASFDYVLLDECFDLRPFGVQLQRFYKHFHIAAPRCLSGFPALQSGRPALARRVLEWCVQLGATQHCRASSTAPRLASPRRRSLAMSPFAEARRENTQVVRHVSLYVHVLDIFLLSHSMLDPRGIICCAESASSTKTLTCNAFVCGGCA